MGAEEEDSVNVVVLSAEEFEQMKAENEEKQKQMLYTVAEYENSRKRTEREKEDFLKYANENFVKDLIPVMDSIDHAVEAARSTDTETTKGFIALREGVELIQKQLLGSLEKRGARRKKKKTTKKKKKKREKKKKKKKKKS